MNQPLWAAEGHDYTEREQPRFTLSRRASMTLGDGREVSLQLRDISIAGFAGRSIEEVEPGTHVTLVLPEAGPVAAEILWQIGPTMGGRFLDRLPLGQIEALTAEKPAPPEAG
jgi:hypothetical protein